MPLRTPRSESDYDYLSERSESMPSQLFCGPFFLIITSCLCKRRSRKIRWFIIYLFVMHRFFFLFGLPWWSNRDSRLDFCRFWSKKMKMLSFFIGSNLDGKNCTQSCVIHFLLCVSERVECYLVLMKSDFLPWHSKNAAWPEAGNPNYILLTFLFDQTYC